jgi:hypothetical protein
MTVKTWSLKWSVRVIGLAVGVPLLAGLIGCAAKPPVLKDGPSGHGWMVYNQSYNVQSVVTSTSSNSYSQTTTTNYSSSNKVLTGSPLVSRDTTKYEIGDQLKTSSTTESKTEAAK